MSKQEKVDYDAMSIEETRKYVTPYAFGVAERLLGLPLASPMKRFLAIAIDGIIIGLLANINGTFLGSFILIASLVSLYKMRSKTGRRFAKFSFSLIALICLLVLILDVSDVEYAIKKADLDIKIVQRDAEGGELVYLNDSVSPQYDLVVADLVDASGNLLCPAKLACDVGFFDQVMDDVASRGYDDEDAKDIFQGMKKLLEGKDRLTERMDDLSFEAFLYETRLSTSGPVSKSAFSFVRWVNSLVADVGLSIGWAALYFSVFIAWWEGQTIGKLLLGIRVIKINGKGLDLWESFERYGGYAAVFATGLLGFVQVVWDSNRQAIHDKISETVVIDLRKKSRQNKN